MTSARKALLVGIALVLPLACSDDTAAPPAGGPYRLTFRLDASFQTPHGGQDIAIAIVRASDGSVVVQANGAVSATQDPSFLWSTGPVMQAGIDYEVHYWIDSNFGGGTSGVCDPKAIDHQWSVEFMSVSNDITWTTSHEPALTEDVCTTFP
ncbi:MAG: hypothetical protein GTN78_03665 [Gemmatimonadales bacterium]|nr:hypothetical protein [Gemmatimonadales bacterium]NIQ99283.1 hypothetical protein [Gemmatimonadales bacterium]